MGVLVGTSLIVIIPEGIETLYSVPPTKAVARSTSSIGTPPPADAASGRFGVDLNDRDIPVLPAWIVPRSAAAVAEAQIDALPIPPPPTVVEAAAPHDDHSDSDSDDDDDDHHHDDDDGDGHGHETNGAHRWIGLSLISGFILMYLIDVLPNARSNGDNQQPYHIALDNLRSISPPPASAAGAAKPNAITLGLVIHAAADGIALGASSTAESVRLSAIIFLAIMLHKAPAAFGLTAVLLRSGMVKKSARNHLLVFSLAAPTGALVTWALVTMLGGSGAGMQWWTGVLLLFSGGTFL